MILSKATDGTYLGASPFDAPTTPTLWGLPVVPMSGMTEGQALVGAFTTAAQLFLRGAIKVAISNSHADFFIKDLLALRAEVRAALHVYRPGAFALVTGISFT
jgi:HK97 family phage major capsid protein